MRQMTSAETKMVNGGVTLEALCLACWWVAGCAQVGYAWCKSRSRR